MEIAKGLYYVYEDEFTQSSTTKHYPHTHTFYELYFHINGDCSFIVEDGIYKMNFGSVGIIRSDELHTIRIDQDCQFTRLHYHIFDVFNPFVSDHHLRCFNERKFGKNCVLQLPYTTATTCLALFDNCNAMFQQQLQDFNMIATSTFLEFLSHVNYEFDQIQKHKPVCTDPLISRSLQYIHENFKTLKNVNEIAQHLFTTRENFSRRFTNVIGISPIKYITMKKIEYAKYLLRNNTDLNTVCEKCGWNDYSYFIYVFRKNTGFSPAQFKKQYQSLGP